MKSLSRPILYIFLLTFHLSCGGTTSVDLFTVEGSISGIAGTVVLQNNGEDDLTLSADGDFTFATELEDGAAYSVTVLTQPDGQTCSVAQGTGEVESANVTDVIVTCAVDTYTVGGTVTGLTGTVVLQNNLEDDLSLTSNGDFTFATPLADGADYSVTVLTQPAGQTCTPSANTGTLNGADVIDVTITCANVPPCLTIIKATGC